MKFETSDRVNIHYERADGDKEAIVFVHGWPHNGTVWKQEADLLHARGHTVIRIDQRGHGKSDKPDKKSAYNMQRFAQDLRELTESLDEPATVVGHSFGGMVSLQMMKQPPKNLAHLVLVDTSYENPAKHQPFSKYFEFTPLLKNVLDYVLKHEHIKHRYFPDIDFSKIPTHKDFYYWFQGAKHTSIEVILKCLRDMLDFDATEVLDNIHVPTLIIVGENDKRTPPKLARLMDEKIPDSLLKILPSADHDTNIENPELIADEIDLFLRRKP